MTDDDLFSEALERFRSQYLEAGKHLDAAAFILATADAAGRPSARTVLLKVFDEQGFVFFTNIGSRKGHDLAANPRAALCAFWQPVQLQISIEGRVEEIAASEADRHWSNRTRENQLAAWASHQSEPLDKLGSLHARLAEHKTRFKDRQVPRPPYWSGYRVVPDRLEFWKSGWHRLSERTCYYLDGGRWFRTLLNP